MSEFLNFVRKELFDARAKWYDIGIELDIPTSTLKSIKSMYNSPADCLVDMLDTWLKQIDPKPSWKVLINALEQPTVAEKQLAKRLRHKYYPSKKGMIACVYIMIPDLALIYIHLCSSACNNSNRTAYY